MVDIELKERVVGRLLRTAAERYPDRVFFECAEVSMTYRGANEVAARLANGLTELGMRKGGKLAIMLPNSPEFLYSWFGAAKIGAVYVPINTAYRGDILQYQLDRADVTHIVVDAVHLDTLRAVAGALPKLTHVILRGAPGEVAEEAPEFRGKRVLSFADALSDDPAEPDVTVAHSDPHAIAFTSGTTGPSKGVLASNAHVVTFALDWIKCTGYQPGQAIFSPLPQFHAIASWLGVVPTVIGAGRIAFVERFSASRYWDDVRRYNADIVHGIHSMVPILLKQPARPDDGTQPARTFYIGQDDPEFERRFNCRIVNVFGSTETGIVTMIRPGQERRLGSCGRVNTDTFEVMLANDRDEPVGPGEVGEILVRPRHAFAMLSEYYGMPEASVRTFQNFWFHTGDNARMDEDGYFYFVDRKKDAIRRRGENISSFELETVVMRHTAVAECAAVAVASDLGEDDVKIAVVLREGCDLGAEELWAFCEAHMPEFWIPRYIELRDSLPKTENQKVRKFLLRDGVEGGRLFDRGLVKRPGLVTTAS